MRTVTWRAAQFIGLVLTLAISACDETPTAPTSDAGGSPGSTGGATSTATVRATRYLAFGASMTAGEITTPAAGAAGLGPMVVISAASYPVQLQQRLRGRYVSQVGEISVVNAGQPGELVASGAPRLSQLLANSQTEALLLLHGHNDLLDYGAGGVSPAIAVMDRMAKEGRHRGARVFIALLPPPIPGRQRSVPDEVVRAFNDRLRDIAAGEGAVVVDLYRALSTDVSRYIGVDGHHPTEAGYQRIAEEFLARITEELQAP
jgi:lysophospholipase L1-like esterase